MRGSVVTQYNCNYKQQAALESSSEVLGGGPLGVQASALRVAPKAADFRQAGKAQQMQGLLASLKEIESCRDDSLPVERTNSGKAVKVGDKKMFLIMCLATTYNLVFLSISGYYYFN